MAIRVECYAGYRGEQEPLAFWLGERRVAVRAVVDRWFAPRQRWFRVDANDGNMYVLRQDDDPQGQFFDRIVDDDRVGRRVGRGDCHPVGDFMKGSVEGRCRLTGETAYRKAITTVRRDRDIQNGVTHAERRESLVHIGERRPELRATPWVERVTRLEGRALQAEPAS